MSAQLWSAISALLAALGVTFEPTPAVKAVISAAGALVIAVVQWQHHKTIRNADTAAAGAIIAKASGMTAAGDLALFQLRQKVGDLHAAILGPAAPAAAPPATPPADAPVPATESLTQSGPSGYGAEHD